jgi:flagellar P-ring protein precursor FlgI
MILHAVTSARRIVALVGALLTLLASIGAAQSDRIGDLTVHGGDVPIRLTGYSLVVGLDGTGDRDLGNSYNGGGPTVRSIANALRKFGLEVPPDQLRPRNVAAVLVTAEVSPWLRAGGRFEVQVASLGDARSLAGGVLWQVPLMADVGGTVVATGQGAVLVANEETNHRYTGRRGGSGRIPEGGVMEADPTAAPVNLRLVLRRPDFGTASRIAKAIVAAYGAGTARVDDPGSVSLISASKDADSTLGLLAAVDTLTLAPAPNGGAGVVVIDRRNGTVVAGGDIRVRPASVTQGGMTLRIGAAKPDSTAKPQPGVVDLGAGASALEVAAGLQAAGATPQDIASAFDALNAAGALTARVVIR